MKIVLTHQIQLKDYRNGFVNIYKEFESDVVPHKGDYISDSCFKDPYEHEVVEVIINYRENECTVSLKPIVANSDDRAVLRNYVEMSELHDWYCPTKNDYPLK